MASTKIIGKVAVKVMPDTSRFKDKLKQDLERIERQIGDLKVDVVPTISAASKKALQAEMKALQKQLSGKNIDIDPELDNRAVAAVETALAVLTRGRKVHIGVDLDRRTFANALEGLLMLGGARPQLDALAEGFERLKRIDYIAISTGLLATKVLILGGAALAASGHILTVAGGIGKIALAAIPLPGLLGGIAIGLGSTVAAFKDFNTYVPQAEEYMGRLQNAISGNFWEQAAGRINDFIDGVFPILLRNLRETGTALGNFFGSLAESLGTKLNPGLDAMFADLNESIQIATKSTDSFAQIIRVLGEVGAGYLPRLADWFGNISDRFAAFLTKAQANGDLERWANDGIENLKALGGVISGTSMIFYGLYTAARDAGGATLIGLADGLKSIADTVNSPAFQSGMSDVFGTAFTMMSAITENAGPGLSAMLQSLADVFNKVGPGIAASVGTVFGTLFEALSGPAVSSGLVSLFVGIQAALANIIPTIGPVVGMFASLGPLFGELVTQISAIGAAGIDKLAPTISKIAEALTPVVKKLGEFFTKIANDMTPVFEQIGNNVAGIVTKFGPLIDQVRRLWELLAPALVPALKLVATIIGGALMGVVDGITWVFKGLVQIIEGVIDVFKGIGDVIGGLFSGDFSRVADGFGQIFSGLGDIVMGALTAVGGAIWAWLNGSIFGVVRAFGAKLFAWVAKTFGQIVSWVATGFSWITKGVADGVAATGGVFSRILDVLLMPFERWLPGITEKVQAVWTFLQTAFSAIGSFFMQVVSGWGLIFKTAFEIITGVFRTAWSVITEIVTTVFSVIGTIIRGAWNGIINFFMDAAEGLYLVFKGPWDAIADFLTATWTSIKAGALLIWNSVRQFFDDFINKVRVNLEDGWNAVQSTAKAVWNAIESFFVGWWNGIVNFFKTSGSNIRSFLSDTWDSIKSKVSDIWEKIESKISDVWSTIRSKVDDAISKVKSKMGDIWDDIKTKVDNTWESVKSKIDNTWESIKTKVDNATDRIKTLMSDAWEAVSKKITTAWDEMLTKIGNKVDDAKSEVGKLPQKAVDALAGIGSVLLNAGENLIGGFIQGIGNMFGKVKGKLQELTGKLGQWKGPAPVDRVLLVPAGKMIIDGLIAGLESRYKDVRSSLQGLTKDIAKDFDSGADYRVGVTATLDTANVKSSAISGLTTKVAGVPLASVGDTDSSVHIDNITIPLEDLKQLRSLEDFLDMLRVRTRQGVIA